MKPSKSRHVRLSPEGIAAIKVIHARFPHLSRDAAMEAALIEYAAKVEALRPVKLALLEPTETVLLLGAIKDIEKIHKERRAALLKAGTNPELIKTIYKDLTEWEKLRLRIANLGDFTYSLTPDLVDAVMTVINTLEAQSTSTNFKPQDQEIFKKALIALRRLFPKS
jgi:hypothetical protein